MTKRKRYKLATKRDPYEGVAPLLYAAYGSNLNKDQMRFRCPAATPLGSFNLTDARLVFRGVADVEHAEGESAPLGLWQITGDCLAALDGYEGCAIDYARKDSHGLPVDTGRGLYRRTYIKIRRKGRNERVLLYVMNSAAIEPPTGYYYRVIMRGYRDFGIDPAPLRQALAHSYETATAPRRAYGSNNHASAVAAE